MKVSSKAKTSKNRWIILVVLLALVIFLLKTAPQWLNLASLQRHRQDLVDYYRDQPGISIVSYLLIYIVATALSIPGATLITLAGGAIFGVVVGTLLASIASSLGAVIAFLASRYFFRGSIERRFSSRLKSINEGLRRDGSVYLLSLRLVPLFPFWLVNLLMGLTALPVFTFYWISQIGMFPGTFIYVNAGTRLAELKSLAGILEPKIFLSLAALGVFPLIIKFSLGLWKTKKLYRGYVKPKKFDYNLVVIGAGAGGLVSAYIAAALKSKVVLIERDRMGGECLYTGCVPSKALIRSGKIASYIRRAPEFGLKAQLEEIDFSEVMARIKRVIQKIEPHDSVERYSGLGVECIKGDATLLSPFEIQIGKDRVITARSIILATGSEPRIPDLPGLKSIPYLTSDTIWDLKTCPEAFLILGGGPIGCELAQGFQRLGVQVTLVEKGEQLLGREDQEASKLIFERLKKEGVKILLSSEMKNFSQIKEGHYQAQYESQGRLSNIEFTHVLITLGRKARTLGLGLDQLKIELTPQGTIQVDEYLQTRFPNILVCGDAAGPYQFTHMAAHQAGSAAPTALFSPLKKFKIDYSIVPWTTFTDPEVARVGLSQREAEEKGIEYEVTHYDISDLDRAIADEEDVGFLKVLTPPGQDKILGVTMVGTHAGDLIAEFVGAMKNGIGLNKILSTIHIYPTLAESNRYVAGAWKRKNTPEKALQFLKKFHAWRL